MIALLPDGLEIAYDEAGSGAPLLFVHGWPHNRSLWAGQMSGLPTQARCIAPDLRGFGGSSETEPYSMEQYADDLAALLDSLGIDRAVVCGLSMGGYVALAMLRRHPARVRGLILASTRAAADTPEGREKRARLIEFIERRGMDALADTQLRSMVGATTFERKGGARESLRQMMAAASPSGAIGAQRAMMARSDSTDLVAALDVPALVVAGSDDVITSPDEMRTMAARMPHARFELIAGAGHVCAYERPGAFNHVVGELLSGLRYD
jgi:pimeloyl-ACP methyl ester carboxylesterase